MIVAINFIIIIKMIESQNSSSINISSFNIAQNTLKGDIVNRIHENHISLSSQQQLSYKFHQLSQQNISLLEYCKKLQDKVSELRKQLFDLKAISISEDNSAALNDQNKSYRQQTYESNLNYTEILKRQFQQSQKRQQIQQQQISNGLYRTATNLKAKMKNFVQILNASCGSISKSNIDEDISIYRIINRGQYAAQSNAAEQIFSTINAKRNFLRIQQPFDEIMATISSISTIYPNRLKSQLEQLEKSNSQLRQQLQRQRKLCIQLQKSNAILRTSLNKKSQVLTNSSPSTSSNETNRQITEQLKIQINAWKMKYCQVKRRQNSFSSFYQKCINQ